MRGVLSRESKCLCRGASNSRYRAHYYELIDFWVKSEIPRVASKLDIEKAHDHVNWEFLVYVLRRMGFGER